MSYEKYGTNGIDPEVITNLLDAILSPRLNESGQTITDTGWAADTAHYLTPATFPVPSPSTISSTWSDYCRYSTINAEHIESDKANWNAWQQKLNSSLGRRVLAKFLGNDYGYRGVPIEQLREPAETPRIQLTEPVTLFSRESKLSGDQVSHIVPRSGIEYLVYVIIRQQALQGMIILDEEEHHFDLNDPGYGLSVSTLWVSDRNYWGTTIDYFPNTNRLEVNSSDSIEEPLFDPNLPYAKNMQHILEIAKASKELK